MDMRFSSSYRNTSNDTVLSDQRGKEKPVSPAIRKESSLLSLSDGGDGHTSTEELSDVSGTSPVSFNKEEQKSAIFLNQDIQQTEPSSLTKRMLSTSYRNSNRAAVALGVAGGVAGAASGPAGAMFGMSVGSSVGTHLGALIGAVQEYSKTSPAGETGDAASGEPLHDIPEGNHFSNHVIQVVDHAGHHAALGSIGVGVAALLTSLVTGNPIPVALHAAGVYSGAAWAFGLTTGTAIWLRQHVQRSAEVLQREQQTSPGDIEMRPWKMVEETQNKKKIETEHEVITQ